jgi:hypothetical protein
MKRFTAAIALLCCWFWVAPSGNAYGPFNTFGDCMNWAHSVHQYAGICELMEP